MQGPDTDAQDQPSPFVSKSGLQRTAGPYTLGHRKQIIEQAARHHVPAVYPYGFIAVEGGLMAYGFDVSDLYQGAAPYIDRIFRGKKPSDLPVQQPTKFELIINLKTAMALGLTVPPTLLTRADEVIE